VRENGKTRSKRRAAGLSVASNTLLVLGKLIVGLITRSVAVISEAIHSSMDLLAAIIALVAVSISDRPPDAGHPHGHGKFEDLSGALEALLIFGAVVFIIYESADKFLRGNVMQRLDLGIAMMGLSGIINIFVSWHLGRVGKRTDSIALLADAAHLRTDVYSSFGVALGLVVVHFTGWHYFDPLTALVVAMLILREAWQITRRSVGDLLDESLPEEERRLVEDVIRGEGMDFHSLRSRKSGAVRNIDLHLEVNPQDTVARVHETCDRLEQKIQQVLPGAHVLIHPEPINKPDKE